MESWRSNERTAKKKKLLAFFLTGFVLGVIYIAALRNIENSNMLMNSYFFSKYQYMEYDARDLFKYIFKNRFGVVLLLWLTGMTVLGNPAVFLFGFWFGFSMGLIWTMAVLKLGMAGILLCVISMFPHYLLYVPAFSFGLLRIYEMKSFRKPAKESVVAFLIMALLVLVGCLLESYINPVILKAMIGKI